MKYFTSLYSTQRRLNGRRGAYCSGEFPFWATVRSLKLLSVRSRLNPTRRYGNKSDPESILSVTSGFETTSLISFDYLETLYSNYKSEKPCPKL